MSFSKNKNVTLSSLKQKMYGLDAKTIKYYRRNPVQATEDLLGIKLMDSQKYMLINTWRASHVLWCCSRNMGKSFLGSITLILIALLWEDQSIYIVSNVGSQAQETFQKIEEIVLRKGKTSSSILSLKDIVQFETVTSPACKTGFSHAQTGFKVKFYNGSEIISLNGDFDNNRGKRATCVFFDECGFMSNEAITVTEAFATQNTEFKTSIDDSFNIKAERRKMPTKLIYASSASNIDTLFFKYYKQFSMKMIGGDRDYFVADMPCEAVLHPYIDGKPTVGLLTQDKIDSAMRTNRHKAEREYYNRFESDGGDEQIVKWGTIRRNETFSLPEVASKNDGSKYFMAVDSSRSHDNSILTVMKIKYDENIGYYGEIVNCINLISYAKQKNMKMETPEQIKEIKRYLLAYNGKSPDYENVLKLGLDSGSGGGGITAFSDNMLEDWKDSAGITHKGFIDMEYISEGRPLYENYDWKYPNANTEVLRLLSPQKYRKQMVEEFIELMNLDLIKFPKEYDSKGYITYQETNKDGEIEIKRRHLSEEEEIALINIDELKDEITSIHRFENAERTGVTYKLPKDKESKMHDDRAYTMFELAHFLYEIRRQSIKKEEENSDYDFVFTYS